MKINSHVNFSILTWQYWVIFETLKIDSSKKFMKNIREDISVYALICSALIDLITKSFKNISKSIRVRDNVDVFFKTDVFTFSTHDENNHAINLMLKKKSFYDSLYNMSQMKLKILTKYIRENLTFNKIWELINNVATSILFIFKKDKELCFCVNYWELNAIILKNHHLFLLIEKILNWLIKAHYFIKLNLKNTYYHIQIKRRDEWKIIFQT